MSTKKYRIRLTTDEQQELNALVSRGRAAAYKQTHARILLMSDESRSDGGMKDADITSALGVGQSTVERIRKRCVEEGVESALNRKKQLRRRQKRLDGEGEARLIAMACGEPPEGRASRPVRARSLCARWKTYWRSTNGRTMGMRFWCAWMRRANSKSRNASAASRSARLIGGIRLRIRAQWSEQPVHAVCTVGRMAPSRGQRASHEGGLGACDKETGRRGLP